MSEIRTSMPVDRAVPQPTAAPVSRRSDDDGPLGWILGVIGINRGGSDDAPSAPQDPGSDAGKVRVGIDVSSGGAHTAIDIGSGASIVITPNGPAVGVNVGGVVITPGAPSYGGYGGYG